MVCGMQDEVLNISGIPSCAVLCTSFFVVVVGEVDRTGFSCTHLIRYG